ncbi:MAG: hypothetical protein IJ468_01140 [Lachnospiraceae bacterium]|nr:hypothetical protein [Lachnospiraceae bacterium]
MCGVNLILKPYGADRQVEKMDVTLSFDGLSRKAGEELCSMQLVTVSIPGCDPENFRVADEAGTVAVSTSLSSPYPYELKHWAVERDTVGTVTVQYTVRPRAMTGKETCGPYFDFRNEDGGANSSGLAFLPRVEGADGTVALHWDLSRMPDGSRGVCTYGVGDVKRDGGLELFQQGYYAMGDIQEISEGEFGFYWLAKPTFDMQEIADYTRQLFAKMQEFFRDTNPVYRIFVRKDPFTSSGGTALLRSYMFGWNETQSCKVKERQYILAHEMVHNWPQLNDNPYGTTTWYSEGMAEYYSMMLPLRHGLITPREVQEELQKRTDQYYTNPTRYLSDMESIRICWKDRRAQKIPYGRGMIFIANVDAAIRRATHGKFSIDDVMLMILEKDRAGVTLGNQVFLDVVKEISGLDVKKDLEDMRDGVHIVPAKGSFGGYFDIVEKEMPEADTGKTVVAYQWVVKE